MLNESFVAPSINVENMDEGAVGMNIATKRIDNALSLRVTKPFFDFIEGNAKPLVDQFIPPTGIPVPSGCTGDFQLCCGQTCKVRFDFASLKFAPTPPATEEEQPAPDGSVEGQVGTPNTAPAQGPESRAFSIVPENVPVVPPLFHPDRACRLYDIEGNLADRNTRGDDLTFDPNETGVAGIWAILHGPDRTFRCDHWSCETGELRGDAEGGSIDP